MSITTAKEYKQQSRKLVTLPSGSAFMIRKAPAAVISEFVKLGPMPKGEQQDQAAERLVPFFNIVFPNCVVSPVVKLKPENDDELAVDDIHFTDAMKLFTEILEFSGLTKEAAEARETFREQSPGQDSPTPS